MIDPASAGRESIDDDPIDTALAEAVDGYLTGLFGAGGHAAEAARVAIRDAGMPEISVSELEGRFLHLLAHLAGARQILEIGTLGGYAAIWMARALPPEGRLVSLEIDPDHASIARANLQRAGLADRVDVRVGRALDLLPALATELSSGAAPFDMVFIDADKEPYVEYFDWAVRLSRPGTLIVADNVIRGGRVLDPSTDDASVRGIRRFNEALAKDSRVIPAVLQTIGGRGHDGMALAVVSDPAAAERG